MRKQTATRQATTKRVCCILLTSALHWGCSVGVAQDLSEADANRVIGELNEHSIGATKSGDPIHEGRYLVEIASEDLSPALAALHAAGLPPEPTAGVLEALGQGGLVPSRKAEQARLVIGTAGELERSLSAVSGVISARVHLSLPENDPLAATTTATPSASVLIRHRGNTPPLSASDVQRLVAGAVSGLAAEQVVVVYTGVVAAGAPQLEGLVRLGPLTVSQSSVRPLRTAVAVALGMFLVLVGALLAVWLKGRNQVRTAAAMRTEEPS